MDALTVAKEITIVLIGKLPLEQTPEAMGENAAKVFEAVLKGVIVGINEANKIK